MTERRELTEYEKECAARLKSIWLAYKAANKVSQAWLGDQVGGLSQSAVGQYINGIIPLNISIVLRFANALGCKASDIDPESPLDEPMTDKERLILLAYRESDEKSRELLFSMAELALSKSKP